MSNDKKQPPPAKRDAAHEARLAAELRANLGRRKALSRARAAGDNSSSTGAADDGPGETAAAANKTE